MATVTKTAALRVNVTPEVHAQVEAEASRLETSGAAVVRRALTLYFNREENHRD
jgi:hypothetical protein